jgi:hypothetical protein
MPALDKNNRSDTRFETRECSGYAHDATADDEDVRARVKSRRWDLLKDSQLDVGQLVRPERLSHAS